jgi:hypothetical protein
MNIQFKNEDGCKFYQHGNYQFFANRQGADGYTLEVAEFYHVPDKYISNRYCLRDLPTTYEAPSNLDRIRERIIEIITERMGVAVGKEMLN